MLPKKCYGDESTLLRGFDQGSDFRLASNMVVKFHSDQLRKQEEGLQIPETSGRKPNLLRICRSRRNGEVSVYPLIILLLISLGGPITCSSALNSALADDLLSRSTPVGDSGVPLSHNNGETMASPIQMITTTFPPSSTGPTKPTSPASTPSPVRAESAKGVTVTAAASNTHYSIEAPMNSSPFRPSSESIGGAAGGVNHIKLTIPIPLPNSDSPIIVKHGNVIYEVINNGTVSTSKGSFAVPIIRAMSTASTSAINLFSHLTAVVIGFRVEESAKPVTYDDGASRILANRLTTIRFFGTGFTNKTIIRFVAEEGQRETDCDDVTSTKYFHFEPGQVFTTSAVAKVQIPPLNDGDKKYYLCVKEEDNPDMPWIHQGPDQWVVITTYKKWLPVWAHIVMLAFLLLLSGLFSGLNLGLMAIDRTELKIIMNAGSEKEKRYAHKIRPLRENGNYLLCSLLLGNVLVNATLTILLDDLTTGLIAVVGSTLGIVIFGEIVPQAVCSRHGLAIGAKTVWITKIFMLLTFPMSYPISVILDKVLGEEIGNIYNRERLKELIRITQGENDLGKDEVNIISGALDLKQKTVADVMTRLESVFMLPIDSVLDFETVSEIMNNGYSRIPVYEHHRGNVISLLYTKDLAFVDPDDKMPLRTICEFYNNPCHFVFENVTLNVIFNVFKQGNKGHMAFVQRIQANEKSDPSYEILGLVTMEDIIEELIQEEISDETDVWAADAEHRRNSRDNHSPLTDIAMNQMKTEGTTVSPQLTLAAFQYLSTAVEEFNDKRISKTVLERLLKQNIYFHIKIKNKTDSNTIIYERGKPADYFIMILEGRVQAQIGKEDLCFESGPFSYFGTNSLIYAPEEVPSTPILSRKVSQTSFGESVLHPSYIPDYTVRAITDLTYFQISRSMYIAAKQATLLEKTYIAPEITNSDQEKHDVQLQANFDETVSSSDGKPTEKALTLGKTANRSSISEARSY